MQFKVTFVSEGYANYPINTVAVSVGMDAVDKIRDAAGCNLPLDRISGTLHGMAGKVVIEIDEATARRSGRFLETCEITVPVPKNSLNPFVDVLAEVTKDSQTNEVTHGQLVRKTNRQAILEAWGDAGYPLVWDAVAVEEEEEE